VVIIDEFRGLIDITHLLKWLDRYPCSVECKGSQLYLNTTTWFITSNLSVEEWYPALDAETIQALKRRITNIEHFQ